jgi:hypothetical protein
MTMFNGMKVDEDAFCKNPWQHILYYNFQLIGEFSIEEVIMELVVYHLFNT